MQKTAQAWFTGGVKDDQQLKSSSPSLLADWNAYVSNSSQGSSSASASDLLGVDLEAAVRSTTDKVTGTFNVVSRGVSGSFQSATTNVPSGKSLTYFGVLLAAGVFFVFIAFTMFLPVMVLVPQKFAICFTMGSALIVASFFALKGPKNQLAHMISKESVTGGLVVRDDRIIYPSPRTYTNTMLKREASFYVIFIGSMVGTVYVSMVLHSYVLSVLFSVIQVIALSYYAFSYFPGGSAGMKFLSSALTSSILRCFGR